MGQRRLGGWDRRVLVGFLAVAAMGTALLAPLATIIGAGGSRHDRRGPVARRQGLRAVPEGAGAAPPTCTSSRGTTSTATSRPAPALNIYGQFAGGAAWLAKAVEDKQALYGDKEISVIAGDNIGASPLVDGLFFGEPSTIVTNLMHADFASVGNHEFDKGSAELLRIQNGGCRADVGCTAAPYALANGGTTNTYPGADFQYLSANVVRNDNGQDAVPGLRHQADQERQRQEVRDRHHRRGARGHAHHRHADRRGRPHLPGRGRRRQRGRQAAAEARA